MKRSIAILLVFFLCVSTFVPGIAYAEEPSDILSVVDRIQSEIPDAEIIVENDTIYVVVDDPSKIPGAVSMSRTTSVTSSIGGSYRNFKTTAFATFYPTSQVYMPKSVVDALIFSYENPSKLEIVVEKALEGMSNAAIRAYLITNYGVVLSVDAIEFISECGSQALTWLITKSECTALKAAQNSSSTGKASVVRGYTTDGYTQFYYYPWTDSQCVSFNGYDATWFGGVYDVPIK